MKNRDRKKVEEEVNNDNKEKIEAFLKDYQELSRKHNLDLSVQLQFSVNGIVPRIVVIPLQVENKQDASK